MKKIWILFFIFLFITCPVLGCTVTKNKPITHPDGTIEYDFSKQSQTKASKILYKFVLKELNKTPKEAQDFANITPKTVSAFETDLNGDGKKEIIGVVFTYQNITYCLNFEPLNKFYVLNNKTYSYRDISFSGSSAYNFKNLTAKFDKSNYKNIEQIKLFEENLKNFSRYDVSEITGIKE